MDKNYPCGIHEERIKTLFKEVNELKDTNKKMSGVWEEINISSRLMAQSLEYFQKNMESQEEINRQQTETLTNMNESLVGVVESQKILYNKVDKLEKQAEANENKHTIDLRDMNKARVNNMIKTTLAGAGGAVGLAYAIKTIMEIIK